MQIADVMDKPCKQVNWNRTPPSPYEPGFGFRCFSVAGTDNSLKTKRDIGVTLNLIITYKNTYANLPPRLLFTSLQIRLAGSAKTTGDLFQIIPSAKTCSIL